MEPTIKELLLSDIGLLSMATIGFVVGMAGYFGVFVYKHVKQEESQQKIRAKNSNKSNT